ncbi:MAG: nuclear transport factor 2 family protein [Spirosomataceae bacterium]
MKKIIITTLCFFAVLPMVFAQTQAEALFQANAEEFRNNPMKNILERATNDYVLISGSGYIANKAQIVALFKNVSRVDVSFNDLRVRQFGNTVIATGREHSVRHYNDGTPDLTTDYLSTYVYEIKGDGLVALSGQHTVPSSK